MSNRFVESRSQHSLTVFLCSINSIGKFAWKSFSHSINKFKPFVPVLCEHICVIRLKKQLQKFSIPVYVNYTLDKHSRIELVIFQASRIGSSTNSVGYNCFKTIGLCPDKICSQLQYELTFMTLLLRTLFTCITVSFTFYK